MYPVRLRGKSAEIPKQKHPYQIPPAKTLNLPDLDKSQNCVGCVKFLTLRVEAGLPGRGHSITERKFVEGLEKLDPVKLYVKLPAFFKVPTPIRSYNPDWAIVVEPRDSDGEPTGERLLYLVRKTKSSTKLNDLRPDEVRKIRCGIRHFKDVLGIDYKVVTKANNLRDLRISETDECFE